MSMLSESNDLLSKLSARLPELEWKINGLGISFIGPNLPKGLFRATAESTATMCIAEIKADIQELSKQTNKRSAFYLAQRIQRKVNVLVVLCQIHYRRNKPERKSCFGIKMLSTRQQWISDLELEINALIIQQQAMLKSFEKLQYQKNSMTFLNLRAELGELERRLTLAQETLNRAISS